jgi:hypothetical protein
MRSRECAGGGAGHGCILGRLGGARAVMVRERAERAREMLPSPPRAAQARVQELYTLTSTKSGTVVGVLISFTTVPASANAQCHSPTGCRVRPLDLPFSC